MARVPAAMMLGRQDSLWFPGWIGWLCPVVALACFISARAFFARQSRHYASPGSEDQTRMARGQLDDGEDLHRLN